MRFSTLFVLTLPLVASAGLSAGCAHEVYSPPAINFFPESSAVLEEGRTGVQLGGAGYSALFGVSAGGANARVRHGFSNQIEGSAELGLTHIRGDSAAGTDPNIYAMRVGTKFAPGRLGGHLALAGGLGAGHTASGFFTAADTRLIVAYENDYLVPYLSGMAFGSVHIDPAPVDTTELGDEVGTYVDTPGPTWGWGFNMGLRVPVAFGPGEVPVAGSLLVGWGLVDLRDADGRETVGSWGGGLELVF